MFSPDRRLISVAVPETRDRDAVWLIDAATGAARPAVRFTGAFRIFFRAGWVDNGQALIINRYETLSHIVLFDHFWAHGLRPEDR